ncbi:hypothetical protein M407DRAFT_17511 [Tulasnella calospora MUT 4182]|uniref:Uncharacterized protein n=1 Tax=Tulasnella calospora MUT 4182 TaxID=1051891 RepID=A0A0C3QLE2_9AGAM|nr:hypothetical protein M407DRAFT_17511 [Tulasnella calospora MUT 4182]
MSSFHLAYFLVGWSGPLSHYRRGRTASCISAQVSLLSQAPAHLTLPHHTFADSPSLVLQRRSSGFRTFEPPAAPPTRTENPTLPYTELTSIIFDVPLAPSGEPDASEVVQCSKWL